MKALLIPSSTIKYETVTLGLPAYVVLFQHARRLVFFFCGLLRFDGGRLQYEDDVLEAVFGGAEGLKDEAAQDSFVALVALPGYFVAVALIAKMGPRNIQVRTSLVYGCVIHKRPKVPLSRCSQKHGTARVLGRRQIAPALRVMHVQRRPKRAIYSSPMRYACYLACFRQEGKKKKEKNKSRSSVSIGNCLFDCFCRWRVFAPSSQVQGFFAMTLLFAVIGLSFRPLRRHAGMLMLLYRWEIEERLACTRWVVDAHFDA